jgi:hypothetical protein
MKKTVLFSFFLLSVSSFLFAQNETRRTILINTAKSLELASRATYSSALIKAKEKGWPLFYKSRNNSTASLIGLDAFGQPRYLVGFSDPTDAITVNTNKIWPGGTAGFLLSGSSDSVTNKLGIWDEGKPRITHRELVGRVTQKDNATKVADHSTHTIGIMMSTGINPMAKGMAYGIKGVYAYDWNNDASEMASAAANGLLISNHSYGIICGWDYNQDSLRWEFNGKWNENEDYKFGQYDQDAQTYDSIAYNAPNYLIVKSAGNNRSSTGPAVGQNYWRRDEKGKWFDAGVRPAELSSNDSYGSIPTDANAKNILTIGAVSGLTSGYAKKEDVVMTSFSSWGPTDDGRIKPDLVADGVSVYSTYTDNDSSYAYLSGTSMSSPNAAGSLLLLQELSQLLSPKKFIRAATVKALAIHTANEAGIYPGPDYKFGWGLLNMSEAASVLSNALSSKNSSSSVDLVYEKTLMNSQTDSFTIKTSGLKPLKATLAWTDVKGTIETTLNDSTLRLVNDLDLKISKSTTDYLPWTLNPSLPDFAAKKLNNSIDNVEKVEIDTTKVGQTYIVTVNHKKTLSRGKQDYSLIISGAGGNNYCASTASSAAGTRMDSVSINNISYVNTSTNQYIDNSDSIIYGSANGILSLTAKLSSVDASNATRFLKVFIDYNNNGVFEDTEAVITSAALVNGIYRTSITLSSSLITGSFTKLRIVAMETDNSTNVKACGTYTIGETQDYTLKVSAPSIDLSVSELINPAGNISKKNTQYVTIKINNLGSSPQKNIPLQLLVTDGTNTLLSITEVFTGTLNGFESMNYTFQKPVSIDYNKTYSFSASVNVSADQQTGNNNLNATISSASPIAAPSGKANNCNGVLLLSVTNPNTSNSYVWYDSSLLAKPIAVGSSVNSTSTSSNIYLTQGFQSILAPINNTSLGSTGGYNDFKGNYMSFNATTPLNIETVKLYTGYPGKITFTLGQPATFAADGTVSGYYALQTVSLNVQASSPKPVYPTYDTANKVNTATPYVSGDSGKIYSLNLSIPKAGDYILITQCDSATLFRNNSLDSAGYPIGPNKIVSYTGNSVGTTQGNFQNYFYFFYSTQVSTNDFVSPATTIAIQTTSIPSITKVADTLMSSVGNSYQWFLNDIGIEGATNQTYKATKNGQYKVSVSTGDCQTTSQNILVITRDINGNLITGIQESAPNEINLTISSEDNIKNLIKGNSFYIQFSNVQTQDIALDIVNLSGESVYHSEKLINQQIPQHITIRNLTTGVYFVKVYANKKVYVQRVFITYN